MTNPIKYWRQKSNNKDLLGKMGTIVLFTEIKAPLPHLKNQNPYFIALIKMNKQLVYGQIVDIDDKSILKIGSKVKAASRIINESNEKGIIEYGIKFTLI